jgi:hypothetical protein
MKVSNSWRFAAGTLVLALLSACGDNIPEATDQQLLSLVGNKQTFMGSAAPLSISKRTVECVRLLSGVDEAIYKDMPSEMLGTFKTHCRQDFSQRIADKDKNPLGFKLEAFEDKELAERITKLKTTTDESNRIAAEKERERIQSERVAKMKAELENERKQYQDFVDSIDVRVKEAAPRCQEWVKFQSAAKAKEKYSTWAYRRAPEICLKDGLAMVHQAVKKNQDYLAKQEIRPDSFGMGFSKPYYGIATAEWFDNQTARLEKEIAQMKAIVSAPSN